MRSPPGGSIFSTSAPKSASSIAAIGPARPCEQSRTRKPWNAVILLRSLRSYGGQVLGLRSLFSAEALAKADGEGGSSHTRRHAAVDRQHDAGDELGLVRREEQRRISDVPGRAH